MEAMHCDSTRKQNVASNAEVCIEAVEVVNNIHERNESNAVRTQTQQLSNSIEERKIDILNEKSTDLRCPCCQQKLTVQFSFGSGVQYIKLLPGSVDNTETEIDAREINQQLTVIEKPEAVTIQSTIVDSESDGETRKIQSDSSDIPNEMSTNLCGGGVPTLESRSTKTSFKKIIKPTTNVTTIMISTRKGEQRVDDEFSRRASQIIALPTVHNSGTISLGLPAPNQNNSAVSLICSYENCKKVFTESFQYNLHIKQHHGEKVFPCEWVECYRLFSSKQRLNDHVRCQHTGERPFRCEHCNKMFSSTKNLRAHRLLHTDERPYKCDWQSCNARFRRSHHLTAHRRIHTGERPFPCPHLGCNLAFTKSDHAKRHYLTHFRKSKKSSDSSRSQSKSTSLDSETGEVTDSTFENEETFEECFNDEGDEIMSEPLSAKDDDVNDLKSTVLLDEKEGVLKSIDCENV